MRKTTLVPVLLATVTLGARDVAIRQEFPVEERQTITRSFQLPASGLRRLTVDNVSGRVVVTAADVTSIEISAVETLQAKDAARLASAKKDATVDVKQDGGDVTLEVNGPFRERCNDRRWGSHWTRRDEPGYRVTVDVEARVPREIALRLRTVNDGDVRVTGTVGEFEVENVNGGIAMTGIGGQGRVYALNKDVRVTFDRVPAGPSSFGSLNGDVEVVLPPALAADLRLKTFNGKMFTDFDTSPLAALRPAAERRNGKFVYRGDRGVGLRIGAGGPELSFDAFNGDIRVLKGAR